MNTELDDTAKMQNIHAGWAVGTVAPLEPLKYVFNYYVSAHYQCRETKFQIYLFLGGFEGLIIRHKRP